MKKKRWMILGLVLFVILILLSFLLFLKKDKEDYYKIDSRVEEVKTKTVGNANTYGWIKVQGTNIDLPIIRPTRQVEEDATLNYAWYASLYKEGENRKVIYGHNILNISSDPVIADPNGFRFEALMSFTDYEFAQNNLYIQLTENNEDKLYKIYAVGFDSARVELGESYPERRVEAYIKNVKEKSIYDYEVDVEKEDELISVITCTRYFGDKRKTQFRVDARRVRKNEEINQYRVATTLNYDIMKEE